MRIVDVTVNSRQVLANLSELDIRDILTKEIAARAGFEIDPEKTRIRMTISKKDKGTKGFESYAEITMVNDL